MKIECCKQLCAERTHKVTPEDLKILSEPKRLYDASHKAPRRVFLHNNNSKSHCCKDVLNASPISFSFDDSHLTRTITVNLVGWKVELEIQSSKVNVKMKRDSIEYEILHIKIYNF